MRSKRVQGRVLIAVVACTVGSGCGNFVESNDQTVRATIGVTGGALRLDALSLIVPPHALDHTVTLSLGRATFEAPNGHAFVLDPSHAVFDASAPATLTITYDASVYQHPSEVFVGTYTAGAWHTLTAAGAPEAGAAHAATTHTGTFGIIHCPGGACPTANSDASTAH